MTPFPPHDSKYDPTTGLYCCAPHAQEANQRTLAAIRGVTVEDQLAADVILAWSPPEVIRSTYFGYCVRCSKSVEIASPNQITMINGKSAVHGFCSDCGGKVFRVLGYVEGLPHA